MSNQTIGQTAFDAYRAFRGGRNHDGTPTPTWDDLTDDVRAGWEAAAAAVARAVCPHWGRDRL